LEVNLTELVTSETIKNRSYIFASYHEKKSWLSKFVGRNSLTNPDPSKDELFHGFSTKDLQGYLVRWKAK